MEEYNSLLEEPPLDYYFPPLDTTEPPCVFLDNPSYISPHAIRYRMRMLGFGGEFSAMAGVGLEEKWVDWFKNDGIIINPPRAHIMPVDIVLWAMENPATFFQPRTLVVFYWLYTMPLNLCYTETTMFLYSN